MFEKYIQKCTHLWPISAVKDMRACLNYMSRILAQKICEAFNFHMKNYLIISPKSLKNNFLGITFIVSAV